MIDMERRTFLKRITVALNSVTACIVAFPAVRFLLRPFEQRRTKTDFVRVGPLPAGPSTDPVRAIVRSDKWDSFLHYPPGPVGAVWLVPADGDGAPPRCLQTICPHLGCGIEYDAERGVFNCPCHASDFALDGTRITGPSPRDMDALDCRISEADGQGRSWIEVKYEEFQTGRPDKQVRT